MAVDPLDAKFDVFRREPATIRDRMHLFYEHAVPLAVDVSKRALAGLPYRAAEIGLLVLATSTGFIAPGVDVAIVKELGLSPSISRVVVNFMGCAAAMNALGTATNYVRAHPAMKALVVCIELCSVNAVFADDINDVVIHSLFGDGCAALVIGASQVQEKLEPGKVVVRSSFSQLLDNTEDGIVLGVNHNGITCELSENLPGYIFSGVAPVVTEMLWDNGLQISDIDLWAIHPGGPKIIEQSVRSLGISAELAAQSWDVLARFGNMLSVSLIFVLETMVQQAESAKAISTGWRSRSGRASLSKACCSTSSDGDRHEFRTPDDRPGCVSIVDGRQPAMGCPAIARRRHHYLGAVQERPDLDTAPGVPAGVRRARLARTLVDGVPVARPDHSAHRGSGRYSRCPAAPPVHQDPHAVGRPGARRPRQLHLRRTRPARCRGVNAVPIGQHERRPDADSARGRSAVSRANRPRLRNSVMRAARPRSSGIGWRAESASPGIGFTHLKGIGTLANILHQLGTVWVRRHLPNVALFHYADYQADLAGELLRLARVLGIAATRDRARDLAQYATLDAMRSRASEIAPNTTDGIWHSDERFFRRGGSGDWQQFFTEAEHLRYYHRINQLAPPDLLAWAHEGRRGYDPAN